MSQPHTQLQLGKIDLSGPNQATLNYSLPPYQPYTQTFVYCSSPDQCNTIASPPRSVAGQIIPSLGSRIATGLLAQKSSIFSVALDLDQQTAFSSRAEPKHLPFQKSASKSYKFYETIILGRQTYQISSPLPVKHPWPLESHTRLDHYRIFRLHYVPVSSSPFSSLHGSTVHSPPHHQSANTSTYLTYYVTTVTHNIHSHYGTRRYHCRGCNCHHPPPHSRHGHREHAQAQKAEVQDGIKLFILRRHQQ